MDSPSANHRMINEACCCCEGLGSIDTYGSCPLCDGAGVHETKQQKTGCELTLSTAGLNKLLVANAIACSFSEGCDATSEGWTVAYSINELPGRGQGLCAISDTSLGTLILAEAPLMIVSGTESIRQQVVSENRDLAESADTASIRKLNQLCAVDDRMTQIIARQLHTLDKASQNEFLALADSFESAPGLRPGVWVEVEGKCGSPATYGYIVVEELSSGVEQHYTVNVEGEIFKGLPQHVLQVMSKGTLGGIFLTNAVDSGRASDVSWLFSRSSRINHSCQPNAVPWEHEGKRYIVAARDIMLGEEVCISYLSEDRCAEQNHFDTHLQKAAQTAGVDAGLLHISLFRQQLFVKWGFWCECSRCGPVEVECGVVLEMWDAL